MLVVRRPMLLLYICTAVVVLASGFFLLSAADPSRSVWDGVYTKVQAQKGANLYEQSCSTCHGEPQTGADDGPALAGDGFLDEWKGRTAGDLFDKLSKTMPMDTPGSLKPDEYANLLAFLFSINGFPQGQDALPPDGSVLTQIRIEPKK